MNFKITLAVIAMMTCGAANAQYQLANGTFEGDFVKCYPWEKGEKVTKDYGTQPEGWCISNVPNAMAKSMASQVDGKNGKAVKITNTAALGNGIPAYLTLGTTWATAETKVTSTRNKDGGLFGGIEFTKHPDAIKFVYTREGKGENDESVVLVYSWKGTWTQASVPSNTAVGVIGWGTATKVDMTDRDVNILGREHILGGAVTKTADAELIAVGETKITGSQADWKEVIVPIEYKSNNAPAKINVVFSAAGYQSDASITDGVSVTIDDVVFVYNSELKSATFNGSPISFNGTSAIVNATYDESKLALTSNGKAATIEKNYNASTGVLTVKVKGEDVSVNPSNVHTYTVQFKKPTTVNMTITNAKYATFVAPFAVTVPNGVDVYKWFGVVDGNGELKISKQTSSVIPAHTPVILYSTTPVSCSFTEMETESTQTKSYLIGVYQDTPAPKGSYVLQNQNGKVAFYKVGDTQPTVKANHAYVTLPGSSAKALNLPEEEVTAINAINALTTGTAAIYDTNGARQNTLQKGMNIVKMADGSVQKVLVK